MSNSQEQAVYREVRSLLPEMEPEMRAQAEALLVKAERGQKTDVALLRLIRSDPRLRDILAARLSLTGSETVRSLYTPPPGNVFYTPPPGNVSSLDARKFVCPQCEFTRRIQKVGQDPGLCPVHGLRLIPLAEKKEGR